MSTTAEREALAAVLKAKFYALCEMGAGTGSRLPNFWQLMADSALASQPSEPRAEGWTHTSEHPERYVQDQLDPASFEPRAEPPQREKIETLVRQIHEAMKRGKVSYWRESGGNPSSVVSSSVTLTPAEAPPSTACAGDFRNAAPPAPKGLIDEQIEAARAEFKRYGRGETTAVESLREIVRILAHTSPAKGEAE